MAVSIRVTPEQVRLAKLEVRALRSAGLKPDPVVERLANASSVDGASHRESNGREPRRRSGEA